MHKYRAHALFDNLSFADYLQALSAAIIERSEGPMNLTMNSFAFGRKDIEPEKYVPEKSHFEMYNNAFETRMEQQGFSKEEIAALSIMESFGVIDTKGANYTFSRFNNKYFKNLLDFGKADKHTELISDKFLLQPKYKGFVKKFADDKKGFFKVFEKAFIKSTRIGYSPKQLGGVEEFFNTYEIRNP